ncbi:MAG TPA: hypothetical protein VFZ00_11685 [Solirubrobacter sp.]|nr:hypothetical protein [Solirubrobacter sp.]
MRTKRRSRREQVAASVCAVVLLGAIAMLALTRSTAPPAPSGKAVVDAAIPPENEAAEIALGTDPNALLDLKQASGEDVSVAQVRRMQAQAAQVEAAATDIQWEQLGPYNIGGRLTDVVADVDEPRTLYSAVAGGGIWRSEDAGETWTNVWPNVNTQPMGALAQASDGTLWAGTGEANPPGGGLTYFGDGVHKSTDDGKTWTHMGLRDSEAIGRIATDPTNPNRVFVAASGHIARSSGDRGLYRTEDAGKTWKLVLPPPNASTGAIDVVVHPTNPQIVFASLWDHRRTNGRRIYGGVGSGLYRSTDGGDTWTRLENIVPTPGTPPGTPALAPYDQTQTGLTSDPSLGRIGIAVAPSKLADEDNHRVYIVFGNQTGPDKGFYLSTDNGDSFYCPRTTVSPTPSACGRAYQTNGGFQWWFGRIFVDPEDPLHIFNSDVNLRASLDGGKTWQANAGGQTGGGSVHADQHGMDWDPHTIDGDPATPPRVYLGNDAGTYKSENDGLNGSWVKAAEQPWNQAYSLAISMQDERRLTMGLQDNGSVRTWPSQTDRIPATDDLHVWPSHGGGDGHWNAIDPTDDRYYYACSQSSGGGSHSCRRYVDRPTAEGGTPANGTSIPQTGFPSNQRYTTHTPLVIDPNNPEVIYIGGATIGRNTNRGIGAFTMISPVMPAGTPNDEDPRLPGPVPVDEQDTGLYQNLYGAVTHLAPAKSKTPVPYATTIYAGTDTGRVWKTTNADDPNPTWTRMQGLPERWVNYIIVDPDDENHVYVAFSGFRQGDDAAHVYETRDGGDTWQNISFNLPNGPVESIEYNHRADVLFAATDTGVYDHKDGDPHWYKVSVGMPQVPVLDIKLNAAGTTLYAATFGRSVWRLRLSTDALDGGGAGEVGGTVPPTLSLSLGGPALFGPFTPGVGQTYETSTTANVISSAGDATLSVADSSPEATGHLVNGSFSLPEPLQARARNADNTGTAYNNVGSSASPLNLLTYDGPVSNDTVTLGFSQRINANDALRTGTYSKTLTFTLSTTSP